MTRGQMVTVTAMTPDGMPYTKPVDVSIPAIKAAMDACGIEDQAQTMRIVRWLWHETRRDDEG